MAAMTTVLTAFSTTGNVRTTTLPGHTAVMPKIVIEKRRVPEGNQVIVEQSAKVVCACVDADGVILPNKISFDVVVRYPVQSIAADVTAVKDILADIVGGDEFAASILTQNWLT